ncbi:dihydrofolate reductase family protein [Dactylosporangium sp. NPDC050588]|uniref:dihydrofolate reductase family protein n=1 Tax=Dactylosporangium sp. NPDC050588 TaxID=3157211 RepID=UPI0033F873EF
MRKLVYMINMSVDGCIAGPEGEVGFFSFAGDHLQALAAEFPETVSAPMRAMMGVEGVVNKRFDTVVMGSGSYRPALEHGMAVPFPQLKQYVVSQTLTEVDPAVSVVADPVGLLTLLKQQQGRDIWLSGGGKLASSLVELVDDLILIIHPVVAGDGVRIFDGGLNPVLFACTSSKVLGNGVTIARYERAEQKDV